MMPISDTDHQEEPFIHKTTRGTLVIIENDTVTILSRQGEVNLLFSDFQELVSAISTGLKP